MFNRINMFGCNNHTLETNEDTQELQEAASNHKTNSWLLLCIVAASVTTIAVILSDLRYAAHDSSANATTSDYKTKAAQFSLGFLSICCIIWAGKELFSNCRSSNVSTLSNTNNTPAIEDLESASPRP